MKLGSRSKLEFIRKAVSGFMAFVLTLSSAGAATPLPTPTEEALKEAFYRQFGPRPPEGAKLETIVKKDIDGKITHYVSTQICDRGTNECRNIETKRYRESVGIMQVDGHFFAVETVDRIADNSPPIVAPNGQADSTPNPQKIKPPPKRLDMTAMTWKNKPGTDQPDLNSMLSFRPTFGPTISEQIAPYLPGLVSAAQASLQNLQQALQTSMVMHQAYKAQLGTLDAAAAGFRAQAASVAEAAALNQALGSVSLGTLMAQVQGSARSPDIQQELAEFRKIKADPLAYKQYELTDRAQEDLKERLSAAIKQGQVREVARLSEIALNQIDPQQSDEFERFMGESQRDGVIEVGHVFPKVGPAPLDEANFQSQRLTPGGQAVRRVANLAQTYWEEKDGFRDSEPQSISTYLSALSTLAWADNAIVQGHIKAGYALLDLSQSLLHGSVGFGKGIIRSATSLVEMFPEMANAASDLAVALRDDPRGVVNAAGQLIARSPEILDAMTAAAVQAGQKFIDGDAAYRGEVLGQIAGDILIGAATGGIGSVVAKSAQGAKAISWASKGARATTDLIARTPQLTSALARSATEVAETAKYFGGARGADLLKVATRNPQLAMSTLGATRYALKEGSPRAADFVARASRSAATYMQTPGGAKRAAEVYVDLERKLEQITPVEFEGTISRAVLREVEVGGKTIVNTEGDVFKVHPGMKTAEGRFTVGGPEGNSGLYVTVGDGPKAWETLIDELGISKNGDSLDADFVVGRMNYKSQRILDLTDETNLQVLGIRRAELKRSLSEVDVNDELKAEIYLKSNVIGDLADQNFDGILFESSKTGHTNIVLFNKEHR